MESKRKTRKVRKVISAIPVPKQKPRRQDKPVNPDALIMHNGMLVESLIEHEGWEIIEDLIDEGVASVSGRKTNGYYYNGDLSRGSKNKEYLVGYQEALTQLYNRIKDFISLKAKLLASKEADGRVAQQEVYNPFLEDFNDKEE